MCWFYARFNTHLPKTFNFCCVSPQNICPKVLGIIKIFFGKCETRLCVLFGQQWLLPWNSGDRSGDSGGHGGSGDSGGHGGSREGELDRACGGQGELDGTSGGEGELDGTSGDEDELDRTSGDEDELDGTSGDEDELGGASGDTSGPTYAAKSGGLELAANSG